MWPHGACAFPLWSLHGLFMGCLWSVNLYRASKLIMHALKLYGPHTGRQNLYVTALVPYGPCEWTYNFCSKQPMNSTRTVPGCVMWLGHKAVPGKFHGCGRHSKCNYLKYQAKCHRSRAWQIVLILNIALPFLTAASRRSCRNFWRALRVSNERLTSVTFRRTSARVSSATTFISLA